MQELALYIHWPWCLSKCPYCDFNSRAVAADAIEQARWRVGLLAELAHFAALTQGRRLTSIYFGGGTPSLMVPETAAQLIEAARKAWTAADGLEITIEANPAASEIERFHAFRDAGVNRLSLGIQSFEDDSLRFLGRAHTAREGFAALEAARQAFDRYSFDLIYARPGQGLKDWEAELARALDLQGGHLSLYQLTVEPGTAFFRDGIPEADEDLAAELFLLTQQMCEGAGLPAYEISNHARPGQESRHNLTYWQGGDYIGIGPGAHGRLTLAGQRAQLHQIADPVRWLARVETDGHATAKQKVLNAREILEETALTGLRMTRGLERWRFETITGASLEAAFDQTALSELTGAGLLVLDEAGLRASEAGRLTLNAILNRLLG